MASLPSSALAMPELSLPFRTRDEDGADCPETRSEPPAAETNEIEWDRIKPILIQLYWIEDLTLDRTMWVLANEHNFRASTQKYKRKIKEWKLEKNKSKRVMKHMIDIREERLADDPPKQTSFTYRGRPVTEAMLAKFQDTEFGGGRKPQPGSSSERPSGIEYFTPDASSQSHSEHASSVHDGLSMARLTDFMTEGGENVRMERTESPECEVGLPSTSSYNDLGLHNMPPQTGNEESHFWITFGIGTFAPIPVEQLEDLIMPLPRELFPASADQDDPWFIC